MRIRVATPLDAPVIADLLVQLDYPDTEAFLKRQIERLLLHPEASLWVAEDNDEVLGFISLHFIPQLALAGDFCRVSYFCVAQAGRGRGVGTLLEKKAMQEAIGRGCDRIEVHCHARRTEAHAFYEGRGFEQSPKYYRKILADGRA